MAGGGTGVWGGQGHRSSWSGQWGTRPSLQMGRKSTGAAPSGPRSLVLHPCSPASQSFSCAPAQAGTALSPAALLAGGAKGPAAHSGDRTRAWTCSDLIKAVTAHQVVTRSWGQPEKVVTYLFPHLTYRRVPGWRVVSDTAWRNCATPLRALTAL